MQWLNQDENVLVAFLSCLLAPERAQPGWWSVLSLFVERVSSFVVSRLLFHPTWGWSLEHWQVGQLCCYSMLVVMTFSNLTPSVYNHCSTLRIQTWAVCNHSGMLRIPAAGMYNHNIQNTKSMCHVQSQQYVQNPVHSMDVCSRLFLFAYFYNFFFFLWTSKHTPGF